MIAMKIKHSLLTIPKISQQERHSFSERLLLKAVKTTTNKQYKTYSYTGT